MTPIFILIILCNSGWFVWPLVYQRKIKQSSWRKSLFYSFITIFFAFWMGIVFKELLLAITLPGEKITSIFSIVWVPLPYLFLLINLYIKRKIQNKIIMKIYLTLGIGIIILILCALPAKFTERFIESEGEQRELQRNSLQQDMLEISYQGNSVHFRSKGFHGVYIKNNWSTEFTIERGERFYRHPDKHASTYYELIDFDENSIILKYTSSFDHHSFGRNLITTDRGNITLRYK